MPRNGAGQYQRPTGTNAISGETISSADFEAQMNDLVDDANAPRPVGAGGTGVATLAEFRTNAGLVIGTNIQAYSAKLGALAGLSIAADKGIYATGTGTYGTYDLPSLGRTFLAKTTVAAQREALGVTTVIDEDSFATNSNTRPPSQQSTKAFIENYGTRIFSGNGSADLPGGLILKWGSVLVPGDSELAFSWASAFPNAVFQAIACAGGAFPISADSGVGIYTLNTTGATIRSGLGEATLIRYIAVGN